MSAIASQITGVSIVYSTVCSGADQRKQQSSASLAFVRGIHQWPVNSPHKGPVTRKMFPFDDVIMDFEIVFTEQTTLFKTADKILRNPKAHPALGTLFLPCTAVPKSWLSYPGQFAHIRNFSKSYVKQYDNGTWALWSVVISICILNQKISESLGTHIHWSLQCVGGFPHKRPVMRKVCPCWHRYDSCRKSSIDICDCLIFSNHV